ncbi:MAG: AmmeMemoRadiSam system radical SAM enzyme [Bacteroidales bacterium]|nr:AmmeMemoRadiSam system radical SAM enzyme [Bacteroidales bacterium]
MKEATFYNKLASNKVRCNLCAHHCVISPGKTGICKVRVNQEGVLYTRAYGKTIAQHIDPVEKKPLYHFFPGSQAYSVATPGCNFRCRFCQNWDISQIIPEDLLGSGNTASPERIVQSAKETGCRSIAYTYTEPTIFFEYSYDTARIARKEGVQNVYVSNGYMTFEMLEVMAPFLDAINVDLKAFRDETYRQIIGACLQPVLDNLIKIKQLGIWLEVTSLIIPGINDDPQEIKDMAGFVSKELGRDVPWHISRFFPSYNMNNIPPTPLQSLKMAKEAGAQAGLQYIYPGNVSSDEDVHTKCPQCRHLLIRRSHFGVIMNHITDGHCPECGLKISGVGM